MMRSVSDSGPFIYLATLHYIDVLPGPGSKAGHFGVG